MRILHVFKTYLPDTHGGVEHVIRQMCLATKGFGIDHRILTLSKHPVPERVEVDGIPIRRIKQDLDLASTGLSLSAFRVFAEETRAVDLIHFHFPWPFMDVLQLAIRPGKPYVVSYHSDIVKQRHLLKLYSPLMHGFLGKAARVIAATEPYRRSSPTLQRLGSKVRVIPYGLDPASYPEADPQRMASWRGRLGPRYLLFVGVLRYYKGLHLLLEALQGLDYPLAIVGDGPEGEALRAQCERLGLKNCHFLGRQSEEDLAALYAGCESFVFPSHLRSEAFGMALLEAAMYGKPMLSCEIGSGMSEINLNGRTGIGVPPEPAALREALMTLWEDAELRTRYGQAARARFEAHFRSEIMASKLIEVYREALA
ncbi:glycosyltransferase [Pseudomonas sp. 102515]|uniref:glycosyltransferase n=1 Tax=Pseudomonas sp. 102515 TaxID=3071568 RepID=UPI002800AFF1|nr:glycosyltransferase [Pseudomonas sp. 102515]MDQ7914275.1 glycosyltransferase [Pseudomonas sp. 102515]